MSNQGPIQRRAGDVPVGNVISFVPLEGPAQGETSIAYIVPEDYARDNWGASDLPLGEGQVFIQIPQRVTRDFLLYVAEPDTTVFDLGFSAQ